jgi:hypothetical protein
MIIILAFFGLTWILTESTLLATPRDWLMGKSVFIFKLLSCYACTGFHSGWIIYLLATSHSTWNIGTGLVWGFASAATSLILHEGLEKLSR